MTTRTLPPVDAYATCPVNGLVLEYYAGTFESVYVMLSPFIRLVEMEKERFLSDVCLSNTELKAGCEPVRWEQVRSMTGLDTLAEVDLGLRAKIGAIRTTQANARYVKAISDLFEHQSIAPPNEGAFSWSLQDKVLAFIQQQGYEWVWVGDELCTERKLHWIEDLKADDTELTSGPCNVFTPDKRILWTTHWDSHFSFFCASSAVIARLAEQSNLEGFSCTPTTQVYWSLHPQ
ncbi:DUF2711 family protein [Chitinimonas naiadis]